MCVTEIWDKIFSANQIAEVLNQLFPQRKSVKQSHFFWFDTEVLKVDQKKFVWAWSKMVAAILVSGL